MAKKAKYTVAQGVQLFLIDTILQRKFPPRFRDFIGSGDDVKFFGAWSGIVREHFSDNLSKASFKLPTSLKEAVSKESVGVESTERAKARSQEGPKPDTALTDRDDVPAEFRELLRNSEYSAYFELLEDKDLGRLMLIEYPQETGLIRQVKEQAEEELQDDEKIVDEAIRKTINREEGAITDELYAGIPELDLSNKGLKALPDKIIEKLTGLKKLYLSSNQLTSVPDSLVNLSSLTHLALEFNRLTSVPDSLGNLSSLTELSLSGNRFTGAEKARIKALLPDCKILI